MRKTRNTIWLDSNVFVHAQFRDDHSEACRKLLAALEEGTIEGWVDTTVLHEVSYVLTRRLRWSRQDAAEYLLLILNAPGVRTVHPQESLERAVTLWMRSDKAFVDCLLAALAEDQGSTVCTVDTDDILALGATAAKPEEIS